MMSVQTIPICFASVLMLNTWAYAQDSGLSFLRTGTNAEAAAMGDSQVANSRDAFSTFWNPAGLAAATHNSASGSYHAWVGSTQIYAGAVRLGVGARGGLGFFITASGNDDLEARDGPGPPDETFGVQFLNVGAAFGRSIGPFRVGVAAKYLSERIYTQDASGYGFDFGIQADVVNDGVRFGAALQNVGKMEELLDESTELPTTIRVGVTAFPFSLLMSDDAATLLQTTLSAEMVHVFPDETSQIHVGVGVEVLEVIDVRAGYVSNDALRSYSFGLGFGYESFVFDYAFLPFERGFDGPGHVLSLTYFW